MARSSIAAINAEFRAVETENGYIVRDVYAANFVERNLKRNALKILYTTTKPFRQWVDRLQTVHCVRHRAIDELLLAELRKGRRNVFLLGAGYDMRAARFSEFDANWIEVDSPEMIARKTKILERAVVTHPELARLRVTRIAADLNSTPLGRLLEHGAKDIPTIIVAEGLIHYMDPAAVSSWVEELAENARNLGTPSVLLVTFIPSRMLDRADLLLKKTFNFFREMPVRAYSDADWRKLATDHSASRYEFYPVERQISEFSPRSTERPIGVSQDVALVAWGE
jgi:methyltransferase (TIGR00027 family)